MVKIPLAQKQDTDRPVVEEALAQFKAEINTALDGSKDEYPFIWWMEQRMFLVALEDHVKICTNNQQMVCDLMVVRNKINLHLCYEMYAECEKYGITYYFTKDSE